MTLSHHPLMPALFGPQTHLAKVNNGRDPQGLCYHMNNAIESYDVPLHNHRVIDPLSVLQHRTQMMSPAQKGSPSFPISRDVVKTCGVFCPLPRLDLLSALYCCLLGGLIHGGHILTGMG